MTLAVVDKNVIEGHIDSDAKHPRDKRTRGKGRGVTLALEVTSNLETRWQTLGL